MPSSDSPLSDFERSDVDAAVAAATALLQDGWAQGQASVVRHERQQDGRLVMHTDAYCAGSALIQGSSSTPGLFRVLINAAGHKVRDRQAESPGWTPETKADRSALPSSWLQQFNDTPGRTVEEIIELFEEL